MYEMFMLYKNYDSLHCLLPINGPSGRLIRRRLRLAEFDFRVKYKKSEENMKANALSHLNNMSEMILHDNTDGIPVFLL